jgi:transposase
LDIKDRIIQDLINRVDALTRRVSQLEAFEQHNKKLRIENQQLRSENAELKQRLNKNSSNSSMPPSSDGYKKGPAIAKKEKGTKGGQRGHKGNTLRQIDNPDEVVACMPGPCTCGHVFSNEEMVYTERRQVFELPVPRLEVTEYRMHKAICPICGLTNHAQVPEGVNAPVQYGPRAKAEAVLMNVHYKLPFKKIQLLFNDLFGYPINESTVYAATKECYEKLHGAEETIKSKVTSSKVVHADETGIRAKGKLHWLHTATTQLYTYLFVHENRGAKALESEKSILNSINTWLVHDCWGSYFKFAQMRHAICGAHILRELEGILQTGKSKWAGTFKTFLLNLYHMPFEERVKRRPLIQARYDRICKIGNLAEPLPMKTIGKRGRYKRTKGRNLLERLISEKESMLAFAFNKDVPFTNNLAERDIRPAKVKLKISNCFRTLKGAEIYARIEGFVSTARKQNKNVLSELFNTFGGDNFLTQMTT